MTNEAKGERRLNAGSWAALLYAGAMFLGLIIVQIVAWSLPTDGWSMQPGGAMPEFYEELQANLAGFPSALQPGDRVLAIDGRSTLEQVTRALQLGRTDAAVWHDGQMLRYTIQRGDQILDVDVPIHVIGAAGHLRASSQVATGVTSPAAAVLEWVASVAFALVTVFVFAVRPRALASQALLVIGVPFFFQHYYAVTSAPLLAHPFAVWWALFFSTWILAILPGFLYLTLVFPRPKGPARRFPGLTALIVFGSAWLLQVGPFLVFPNNPGRALTLQQTTSWGGMVYLLLPLLVIGHSLLTERGSVARAQLKWLVLGVVGFVVGGLAFAVGGQLGWSLLISFVQNGGYLMLPVCVAIAIVRHRLLDIDVIIRRTLVYTVVTALLALVFFGLVLVLQRLFTTVSGQTSPVAIVASTLAIAALFSPLRRRVQDFVDRRFYRRKYDAQAVLARFGAVARDETNVDALSNALGAALKETLQPSALGVWLQRGERKQTG